MLKLNFKRLNVLQNGNRSKLKIKICRRIRYLCILCHIFAMFDNFCKINYSFFFYFFFPLFIVCIKNIIKKKNYNFFFKKLNKYKKIYKISFFFFFFNFVKYFRLTNLKNTFFFVKIKKTYLLNSFSFTQSKI